MTLEQQSALSRAFRAWLDLGQKEVALGAGLGERTLIEVEKGRSCSAKTWLALSAYYASQGLQVREGEPLIVIATN